jgi:hypothetical protein
MANLIRIPAGGKAYLEARRDQSTDSFDVVDLVVQGSGAPTSSLPMPWAYYKMEEGDGADRIDSISGRNLVFTNGYINRDSGVIEYAATMFRNSYTDPSGNTPWMEWLAGPADPLYQEKPESQPWTCYFWGKIGNPNVEGDDGLEIVWLNGGPTLDIYDVRSDGHVLYWLEFNENVFDGEFDNWGSPAPLSLNEYHFFCITFDGSQLFFEVDNVEVWHGGTGTPDPEYMIPWCNHRVVPGFNITPAWIDEWAIYDIALTPEQKTIAFNAGAGQRPTGV